jgi:hypothetical protein
VSYKKEFEAGVRRLVARLKLPKNTKLLVQHTDYGVVAILGKYESPQDDGRCRALTRAGRRCRLDATPGTHYCEHPTHKKQEGQ